MYTSLRANLHQPLVRLFLTSDEFSIAVFSCIDLNELQAGSTCSDAAAWTAAGWRYRDFLAMAATTTALLHLAFETTEVMHMVLLIFCGSQCLHKFVAI